jgi:hypothetical protein
VRIDALQKHFLEDALDQVLFGGEIAVEQRLGNAGALRQLARLPGKADLGEKADRLGEDLLLAIGGREALLPLAAIGFGRGAGLMRPAGGPGGTARRWLVGGYGVDPFGGMIGSSR